MTSSRQKKDVEASATLRRRFHDHMGISVSATEGAAEAKLALSDAVTNALGSIHGGAIAALVDVAVTSAARSTAPDVSFVVTISLSVSYLAPAETALTAKARTLGKGRRIVTIGVDVLDDAGTAVATATASLRLIRK